MGAKTTREIAEWICRTDFMDLPPEVVNYSKILAVSHLGMTVAGSSMPNGRLVIDYARDNAGRPEAGIVGGGFRASAEFAALANGNAAHTPEFEDDSFPEGMYSCGVWPAAFAMAEKLKLSGRELIEGLVLGYEVASRLGVAFQQAIPKGRGLFAACSAICSAIAAAKMLRLDVDQTVATIGLVASQGAGITKQTGSGAHLVEAGFAGRNGIAAASLAKLGCTGNETILEGTGGFGDLWADCTNFDLPLGEGYRLMEVGIKKFPCCYLMQRNIDGLVDLIAQHHITWDEVASVEHEINQSVANVLRYDDPGNGELSRFSLPHATVACFLEPNISIPTFSDEKARDPRWREERKKVKVTIHPEWPVQFFGFDSPVTITMKNGATYRRVCVSARGDAVQRFGPEDVLQKYNTCLAFAGGFSQARGDQAAEMALALDKVRDVSELMALLTYPDAR